MTELSIRLQPARSAAPDAPGAMAITATGLVLTRLQRLEANEPDDFVRIPLARFGFWLADNWWRLRYETSPRGEATPDWRLAHEINSIGGGFAWPRVAIWGEGQRIVLTSRADPPGVAGPVRFLTDAIVFVGADDFEGALDGALVQIQQQATSDEAPALRAVVDALNAERADPDSAQWRRLEAIAGFDCDEAPDDLMARLAGLLERYGVEDIEEAVAAHPGTDTTRLLQETIDAGSSVHDVADFSEAMKLAGQRPDGLAREPWQRAEQYARGMREAFGHRDGPLRNARLAELLGIQATALKSRGPSQGRALPYGLRLKSGSRVSQHLLLVSRRGAARRFEAARCLGDAIWSQSSQLGPISLARTARQKFQNAFAASLLSPASSVIAYVGSENPSDEDISAAAQYFHVSEKVVRTILVNKYVMGRGRLPVPPEQMGQAISDDQILDAA
jgi:hypothetical protein